MSAFVVSKSHIDAMLRAGLVWGKEVHLTWFSVPNPRKLENLDEVKVARRELSYETANEVGQMLVDECLASVRYRYPDDNDETMPGPSEAYWIDPYRYTTMGGTPTPVEGLKLIGCYEYQSCEHPDWEESEAHQFCQALRKTLIGHLPGYDEAPWEWVVKVWNI